MGDQGYGFLFFLIICHRILKRYSIKDDWILLSMQCNSGTFCIYLFATHSIICQIGLPLIINLIYCLPLQLFNGNTDRHSVVYHQFTRPFTAVYVRLYPRTWYSWISMRAEIYGCSGTVFQTKEYFILVIFIY